MEERINNRNVDVVNLMMKYNAIVILVVLIIVSTILSDAFFTATNIMNLLRQLVPLTLASLGMLLVILTGGIDLSVASVTAVGGMFTGILIANYNMTSAGALVGVILIVLAVGFLIGSITGFFVIGLKMAPFVATLATMTMARGFAYLMSNGQPVRLPMGEPATLLLSSFGAKSIAGIPWPVILGVFFILLFVFITKNTVFGRLIIASGSNETAVRLAGITVNKYIFFAYAICGALCALGGLVATSRVSVAAPSIATGLELDAIAACVIGGASLSGGKGTVVNTIIGVLVLGLITNVMSLMSIAAYPQQIIKGLIIVLAVFLQHITNREKKPV
ncbi:ABC transporter permease [Sinanaerobacter chloroacetimidivorans]|uniref:ABC transporter permease n=1 Tax=Sinanaerobacter chloroacetimidivorans TaxID=2818044 RepID=A0A8J7VZ91_9FIRM|nr:ABC transporter permease [Sinanaerobacter chloroacetimidivorans]MBR0597867.1 ABC transporter permease [Sinanaerobacter chloroacetimidivorans]